MTRTINKFEEVDIWKGAAIGQASLLSGLTMLVGKLGWTAWKNRGSKLDRLEKSIAVINRKLDNNFSYTNHLGQKVKVVDTVRKIDHNQSKELETILEGFSHLEDMIDELKRNEEQR